MGKNLNVAPTEQELINAGFTRKTHDEDGYNYTHSKDIGDNLKIEIHTDIDTDYEERCASLHIYDGAFLKHVDLTKAAINAEFKHFGQPLPQWEKPKPHQYSYKGLKAEGKIPHDRSGENHDSIEAFKKLLAICEALNGMFRDSGMYLYNPYWDKQKQELFYITNERQDESPIFFTSEEAFDGFKSAPENVELFKTFLKIK